MAFVLSGGASLGAIQVGIERGDQLVGAALDHPDPAGYWTARSLERMQPHSHE